MGIIQPNPEFAFSLRYLPETDIVEIVWKVGILPPIALGLTSESFFKFIDDAVGASAPFIEKLKSMKASGEKGELRATLNSEELDKLMELRKRLQRQQEEGNDKDRE